MATQNPYRGVNAHLNSFLQTEGWESFHTEFIVGLRATLDTVLPPNYYAVSEKSLQVSVAAGNGSQIERPRRMIPDVSVYQTAPSPAPQTAAALAVPEMRLPLILDDEETISAVVVYRARGGRVPGKPVTRLELLSPSNKPGGSGYAAYRAKRLEALYSELRLVEIDLLHELPPILPEIPNYAAGEPGAFPYLILVSDPFLLPPEARTALYGAHVDAPLRIISVPLAEGDAIAVDFDAVYNQTFESSRLFRLVVDYTNEPLRFETYAAADQQRIRDIMARVSPT